jgi:hypothetical protein
MTDRAAEKPTDVQQFLLRHVESYEELELLLLLHQDSARIWSLAEAALGARVSTEAATVALDALATRQLVVSSPSGFGANPQSPHVEVIGRLAMLYRQETIEIMKIMGANAVERVRTSALRAFAKSFILGSKKDG